MAGPFVLDRASILDRLGGDEEIYSMMVDMFLDDVEANSAALASAFASGEATVVQREAHTIKGLLATFSDDDGAAEALAVEKKARAGDLARLGDAVGDLQRRLREVANALRAG
ncbi:Hpt domain-containing protein [uncultured Dechloromonas sp.]|uniref:Hpt domain-containing protein n=1 Tax=uncultured Dechloromonas sp. TaxID=171719 RepID=UPI0025FFF9DA|nr:Hpt domain-containing protein [uncultured Dechloromonas sp.]